MFSSLARETNHVLSSPIVFLEETVYGRNSVLLIGLIFGGFQIQKLVHLTTFHLCSLDINNAFNTLYYWKLHLNKKHRFIKSGISISNMENNSNSVLQTLDSTPTGSLRDSPKFGCEAMLQGLRQTVHLRHADLTFEPFDFAEVLFRTYSVASARYMRYNDVITDDEDTDFIDFYTMSAIHTLWVLITCHSVEEWHGLNIDTAEGNLSFVHQEMQKVFTAFQRRGQPLDENEDTRRMFELLEEEILGLRNAIYEDRKYAQQWREAHFSGMYPIKGCSLCKARDASIDVVGRSWLKLKRSILALCAVFKMCDDALSIYGEEVDPEDAAYKTVRSLQSNRTILEILNSAHPFVDVVEMIGELGLLTQAQQRLLLWYSGEMLRERINHILDEGGCEREYTIEKNNSEYNGFGFGTELFFSLDDGPNGRYTTALRTRGLTFKDISESIFGVHALISPCPSDTVHCDGRMQIDNVGPVGSVGSPQGPFDGTMDSSIMDSKLIDNIVARRV